MQSRLVVTVLQVEGLLEQSESRTLQPFVKILLMWAGSEAVEVEGFKDEEVSLSYYYFPWTYFLPFLDTYLKNTIHAVFEFSFSTASLY